MIVTIAERKRMRVERIRSAIDHVERNLTNYARRHDGSFVIFGSAARGDLTHDSDFDVLVDFPAAIEREARDFAESVCIEHGIRPDVHLASDASPALLKRVRQDGRPLR